MVSIIHLAGYGPLLMLLVTSDTLRQALNQGIRFQQLTHLTGRLSLQISKHKVALCYQPQDVYSPLGALLGAVGNFWDV